MGNSNKISARRTKYYVEKAQKMCYNPNRHAESMRMNQIISLLYGIEMCAKKGGWFL